MTEWHTRLFDRALTLMNAVDFVSMLPADRKFPAFNGHRHIEYTGEIDDRLVVVAGPSSTMGNALEAEEKRFPHFSTYDLRWDNKGNLSSLTEVRAA